MLKKLLTSLCLFTPLFALSIDVEAARLGGGRSAGRSYSAPSQPAQVSRATPNTPAAAPSSPWKGILGGALLGLGLGALFSSLGLGGAMSGILTAVLIGLLAFLVIGFLMRRFRPKTASSGYQSEPTFSSDSKPSAYSNHSTNNSTNHSSIRAPEIGSGIGQGAGVNNADGWEIPADFDQENFLRNAKANFIRMQAAWDKADLNDLREFTTSEMYGQIKVDLQERGSEPNVTEVMSVEARMLGIRTSDIEYVASVQLTGTIKEGDNAPTTGFSEVWYLTKGKQQGGWLLAGIEQR